MARWVAGLALLALLAAAPRPASAIPDGQPDDGRFGDVVKVDGSDPSGRRIACSGVLVDPRYVLTAAHCLIDGKDLTDWQVTRDLGRGRHATASIDWATFRKLEQATPPFLAAAGTGYIETDVFDDIAVLRLDRDLPWDRLAIFPQRQAIEPALPVKFERGEDGFRGFVAGYGSTQACPSRVGCVPLVDKHFREVSIFRAAACMLQGTMEKIDLRYAAEVWCYGGKGTPPTTFGDSGGALFLQAKDGSLVLIGIISTNNNGTGPGGVAHGTYKLEQAPSVHFVLGNLQKALGGELPTPTFDVALPPPGSSPVAAMPPPGTTVASANAAPAPPIVAAPPIIVPSPVPSEDTVSRACGGGRMPGASACLAACRTAQTRNALSLFSNAVQGTCAISVAAAEAASVPADGLCDGRACRYTLPLVRRTRDGALYGAGQLALEVMATDTGADLKLRVRSGPPTLFSQCGTCRLPEYVSGPYPGARMQRTGDAFLVTLPR